MTFLYTLLGVTACLLALLVRSKMRGDLLDTTRRKQSEQSPIHANTSEAGHSHTYFVTKDPKEFAKIFVPRSAKR